MRTRLVRLNRVVRCLTLTTMLFAAEADARTIIGRAVYYNDTFNGRRVALKGANYDGSALTAATHRDFRLGSSVRVTNLRNHKSVIVTVNDRMNLRSRSVIDLSHRAAEELGMIHAGHVRVRVESVMR